MAGLIRAGIVIAAIAACTPTRGKGVIGMLSQRVDHSKPILFGPTHIGLDTCFITPSRSAPRPGLPRAETC